MLDRLWEKCVLELQLMLLQITLTICWTIDDWLYFAPRLKHGFCMHFWHKVTNCWYELDEMTLRLNRETEIE